MLSSIEQFRENIARVRHLAGLTTAFAAMTTSAVDASDMLRAQLVLAVSALDHYVHEITRLGMLSIFDGTKTASSAFLRFRVSLNCLSSGQLLTRNEFDAEIRAQHSYLAFQ
jgi:hypothetical protein